MNILIIVISVLSAINLIAVVFILFRIKRNNKTITTALIHLNNAVRKILNKKNELNEDYKKTMEETRRKSYLHVTD